MPSSIATHGFCRELQSMRGLAAMLVVLGHCFGVFDLSGSPLRFPAYFLNGEGAVIFFFILSGFVLSLQWDKGSSYPYPVASYVLRRITRIYPMLIITVIVGTLYCNFVHIRTPLAIGTNWYHSFYQRDIDAFHLLLSAIGYSGRPAAPLWSLFVELVGSVLVPLFIITASNPVRKYFIALALLLISFILDTGFHFNFPVYLIDFYIGTSIMWWGRPFAEQFKGWKPKTRATAMAALVSVFFLARFIFPQGSSLPGFNSIEAFCTAPIVALLYYGDLEIPVLRSKALSNLGDYSYSIYLIHFPIMYFIAHLFLQLLPTPEFVQVEILTLSLAGITAAFTIAISNWTYRHIEVPFIELGKRLPVRWKEQASRIQP